MKELRKTYPRAYDWMKRYELIVFGTSEKLVFKADASVPLDKRKQVLHRGVVVASKDQLQVCHCGQERYVKFMASCCDAEVM